MSSAAGAAPKEDGSETLDKMTKNQSGSMLFVLKPWLTWICFCQGLYLYKSTLAVLSVQHQTIHVFQLDKEGYFVKVGLGLRA